jgi:molecular chaperone GrpE
MPSSPAAEQQEGAAPEPETSPRERELEDKWKRALADLANFRKRSARLTDERITEAVDRLLLEWLEVVDSVERALAMDTAAAGDLRAVLEQMDSILARHGVQRMGAVGEPFDPERHEAVAVRESAEDPPQHVAEVERSGATMGDRVLRPARVVVTTAPAD